MKNVICTDKAPAAIGPYSQAIVIGDMVFTSGQIPINPETSSVDAVGIVEQTEQVMKNLGAVLSAAGSSFEKAVKTTCFLADISDFAAFNEVYAKYFTEKPALFTREDKKAVLSKISGVALGSDAFFPFSDNIERAKKSGVKYIAEPGGSIRDDLVIECCDKYGMAMAFTGMRLFHH